jgi:hypothetical protein
VEQAAAAGDWPGNRNACVWTVHNRGKLTVKDDLTLVLQTKKRKMDATKHVWGCKSTGKTIKRAIFA